MRNGAYTFAVIALELAIDPLCYNFTRVPNILGFEGFLACMARLVLLLQCDWRLLTMRGWWL